LLQENPVPMNNNLGTGFIILQQNPLYYFLDLSCGGNLMPPFSNLLRAYLPHPAVKPLGAGAMERNISSIRLFLKDIETSI
jgi:hypothetical protein